MKCAYCENLSKRRLCGLCRRKLDLQFRRSDTELHRAERRARVINWPAERWEAAQVVIRHVCTEGGVPTARVLARDRRRNIVAARCRLIATLRGMSFSLKDIGSLLGGMSHSSVIYCLKKPVGSA